MTSRYRLASWIFWSNAVILLGIGFAFIFANEFFPFHADVIQTDWQDLEYPYRTLYLGMMRTEGAGFLASAVAIAFLLAIPFQKQEQWSAWAITAVGITEHLPTLLATFHVSRTTYASPPWFVVAGLIFSLVLGLLCATKDFKP